MTQLLFYMECAEVKKKNHPPWRPSPSSQRCYAQRFAVFAGEKPHMVADAPKGTSVIWSGSIYPIREPACIRRRPGAAGGSRDTPQPVLSLR